MCGNTDVGLLENTDIRWATSSRRAKHTTQNRPDDTEHTSLASGHTDQAFVNLTLTSRWTTRSCARVQTTLKHPSLNECRTNWEIIATLSTREECLRSHATPTGVPVNKLLRELAASFVGILKQVHDQLFRFRFSRGWHRWYYFCEAGMLVSCFLRAEQMKRMGRARRDLVVP